MVVAEVNDVIVIFEFVVVVLDGDCRELHATNINKLIVITMILANFFNEFFFILPPEIVVKSITK